MKIIEKIQKITSKGQITLPVAWRRFTKADSILVTTKGNAIEIVPAKFQKRGGSAIFDAIRDNKGEGIKIDALLKILQKLIKEDEQHRKTVA